MKLDCWTYFMLTAEDRQLLDSYPVPDEESAIIKGLPIQVLGLVKPTMHRISQLTGRKLRVMYRGPRYDWSRGACRKADAYGFSVYFR